MVRKRNKCLYRSERFCLNPVSLFSHRMETLITYATDACSVQIYLNYRRIPCFVVFEVFLPLKFVPNSQDVSILLMPFSVKMVVHNECYLFCPVIIGCAGRVRWMMLLHCAVCRVPMCRLFDVCPGHGPRASFGCGLSSISLLWCCIYIVCIYRAFFIYFVISCIFYSGTVYGIGWKPYIDICYFVLQSQWGKYKRFGLFITCKFSSSLAKTGTTNSHRHFDKNDGTGNVEGWCPASRMSSVAIDQFVGQDWKARPFSGSPAFWSVIYRIAQKTNVAMFDCSYLHRLHDFGILYYNVVFCSECMLLCIDQIYDTNWCRLRRLVTKPTTKSSEATVFDCLCV